MDNNYKQLMAAIVVRAVKDYSKILRKSRLSDLDKRRKFELEQFFKSEWGESLTELDGEFCINKIKESVAKESGENKKACKPKCRLTRCAGWLKKKA